MQLHEEHLPCLRMREENSMPFEIVRSDITKIQADAIVNPTDSRFSGSGGADYAIHKAAGHLLRQACEKAGTLHQSASFLEISVEVDPYMEVRGVRRSWEIARSRLPRMRSFSLSERSFSCSRTRSISCSRIRMFSVLVEMAIISIMTAEKMLSSTKKSKA